jgi:hypothetical protein
MGGIFIISAMLAACGNGGGTAEPTEEPAAASTTAPAATAAPTPSGPMVTVDPNATPVPTMNPLHTVTVPEGAIIKDLMVNRLYEAFAQVAYKKDFGAPGAHLYADRTDRDWARTDTLNIPEKFKGLDWIQMVMNGRNNFSAEEAVVFTTAHKVEVIIGVDMRNNPSENNSFSVVGHGDKLNDGLGFLGRDNWELQDINTYFIEDTQGGNFTNWFDTTWVSTGADAVRYYLYTKTFEEGQKITIHTINLSGTGNDHCNYIILLRPVA